MSSLIKNFSKECPECGKLQTYSTKKSFKRSVNNKTLCRSCNNKKRETPDNLCIDCGIMISKVKTVERCKSCAGVGRTHSISTINKLSEIKKNQWESQEFKDKQKKGLGDYFNIRGRKSDEAWYQDFLDYSKSARLYAKRQPIHLLENYDKRGRAGVDGAYHLDHINPIKQGWLDGVEIQIISDISNLIFIPWKDNLKKGCKIN